MSGIYGQRQPLNTMDRLMAALDQRLRNSGHPGLMLQSQVWLAGRLDAVKLRETLVRLGLVYPVTASRKVDPGLGRAPYWQFTRQAAVELHVHDLPEAAVAAVWHFAEELLNTPIDVGRENPIRFHLLRRPQAGDVFVMQWSHALMDGLAGELALRAVDRLWRMPQSAQASDEVPDEILRVVNAAPLRSRLGSFWRLIRNLYQPRPMRSLTGSNGRGGRQRIAYRILDASQTRAVRERIQSLCGFADPAPVLIAAALRAVAHLGSERPVEKTVFYLQAPVNLRKPGATSPLFRNMQSYVHFAVAPAALTSLKSLVSELRLQLRAQIRSNADLGYLFGATFLSLSRRWAGRFLFWMCSPLLFVFGYHGDGGKALHTFCGADIESIYNGIPTSWSVPGMMIASGFSRQQLFLTVSYEHDPKSEHLVEAFMDRLMAELLD